METAARQEGQPKEVEELDSIKNDLLERKAKKEELRRKKLKRASLFWLVVMAYFGLIVLLAFFIYQSTGLSRMFENLTKKANLIASRERPARGVIRRSYRHKAEPASEQTAVIAPPVPNVEILQHSGRMEGVHYRVSGQIQNTGTAPAINVMVTATFYDAGGEPVGRDTDHVWRRVNSLGAGQKFDFKNILPSADAKRVTRYELSLKWY